MIYRPKRQNQYRSRSSAAAKLNHGSAATSGVKNANSRIPRRAGMPVNSEVRQRVLSARRLRAKTFQNQLADAQQTIAVRFYCKRRIAFQRLHINTLIIFIY